MGGGRGHTDQSDRRRGERKDAFQSGRSASEEKGKRDTPDLASKCQNATPSFCPMRSYISRFVAALCRTPSVCYCGIPSFCRNAEIGVSLIFCGCACCVSLPPLWVCLLCVIPIPFSWNSCFIRPLCLCVCASCGACVGRGRSDPLWVLGLGAWCFSSGIRGEALRDQR